HCLTGALVGTAGPRRRDTELGHAARVSRGSTGSRHVPQSAVARAAAIPVRKFRIEPHHHILLLHVGAQRRPAILLAVAAGAEAAPDRGRVVLVMVIDPDNAGMQPAHEPVGAADIAGPDRGA